MKEVAVIDCETTGLDPDEHEVIEVAVLVGPAWEAHELLTLNQQIGMGGDWGMFDGTVPAPRLVWSTRVKPEHIERAHPKTLELNGYTPEGWRDAVSAADALVTVQELVEGRTIAGQHLPFDLAFLDAMGARAGRPLKYNRHSVDLMTLSWMRLVPLGLHTVSLGTVCWVLGISNEGAHTAKADVLRTWQAMQRLLRANVQRQNTWKLRIEELNRARAVVKEAR